MDKKHLKKKEPKKPQQKGKITEQKRKLLENENLEVFKEEEEEFEETDFNFDEFKNSNISSASLKEKTKQKESEEKPVEETDKQPKKARHLLEEYMLRNIKQECESNIYFIKLFWTDSPVSKLDVKKEYEIYKSNLLKDLGLNNEKELFDDIENELQDIELSSKIWILN